MNVNETPTDSIPHAGTPAPRCSVIIIKPPDHLDLNRRSHFCIARGTWTHFPLHWVGFLLARNGN
ncbi:hypothetical protein CPB85DRAFT_1277952 [Mucidula mucida]|nr:hypothetical protein CPB85DRAFT_1277952 [Mucidula mucida]